MTADAARMHEPDSPQNGLKISRHRLFILLVLSAVAAVYSNSLLNGFHLDDHSVIRGNVYIRRLNNIPAFFLDASSQTTVPANAHYRPMLASSFALDYWWGGGQTSLAFHCTQLALHLLAVLGIYLLLKKLLACGDAGNAAIPLALFGAAWFGLHRANTEAVNYLTARSELLAALGALYTVVAYLHAGRWRKTYLWLLPMIIGAMAKPGALVAPLLIAGLGLFWAREESPTDRRRGMLLAFGPALALAVSLYALIARLEGPHAFYSDMPRMLFFRSQFRSVLNYVWLFCYPAPLSTDRFWPPIPFWLNGWVIAGALVNGLLIAMAAYAWRSRQPNGRLFAYGVAWFYIALAPSASLFPLTDLMREYRLYFPAMGLTLAGTALAAELWRRAGLATRPDLRRGLLAAGLLLLAAQGSGTYRRNRVWRDELTFWGDAVTSNPENGRGWLGLGNAYFQQDDPVRARESFAAASRLGYQSYQLELNWAAIDMAERKFDSALPHFLNALRLDPAQSDAHFGYADWLAKHQQWSASAEELRRGLALNPSNLFARKTLLEIYDRQHQMREYCALAKQTQALFIDQALAAQIESKCRPAGPEDTMGVVAP